MMIAEQQIDKVMDLVDRCDIIPQSVPPEFDVVMGVACTGAHLRKSDHIEILAHVPTVIGGETRT